MVRTTASREDTVRAAINTALQRVANLAGGAIYGAVFALVSRNLSKRHGSRPFESSIDIILYFPGHSKAGARLISYDSLGRTHRWLIRLLLSSQYTYTSGEADKWCSAKCLYNPRGPDPGNPKVPLIGTVTASEEFKRYYMANFSYFAFLGIVPEIKIWDHYPEDYFPCGSEGPDTRLRVAEFSPERVYFYALHQINPGGVSGVRWADTSTYFNILPQNYPMYSGARYALRSPNWRWVLVVEHRRLVLYGNAGNYFGRAAQMERTKYDHVANKDCNRSSNYCYATAMMIESKFHSDSSRGYYTKWHKPSREFMNQLVLRPGLLQLTAESPQSNEINVWKVTFATTNYKEPYALVLTDEGGLHIYDANNVLVHDIFGRGSSEVAEDESAEDTTTPLRSSTVRRADIFPPAQASAAPTDAATTAPAATHGRTASAVNSQTARIDEDKCPPPPFTVV